MLLLTRLTAALQPCITLDIAEHFIILFVKNITEYLYIGLLLLRRLVALVLLVTTVDGNLLTSVCILWRAQLLQQ